MFDECTCERRLNWVTIIHTLTSLRPRRNGRYNADDIFKCIFLKENVWFPTKISLKFVPKGPINNIQALVLIMAWRPPGDKPLSEPMMIRLPTQICVTRPQCITSITVTSHKSHGVSNHRQLDCLFHTVFRLTTQKTSELYITDLLWGGIHQWLSTQRASNRESVSMSWRHHVTCVRFVYALIFLGSNLSTRTADMNILYQTDNVAPNQLILNFKSCSWGVSLHFGL